MEVGDPGPVVPQILRVPQHPLRRLDQRVQVARVGRADGEGDPTERARGQAFLEPLPREAAVLGAINPAPRSARHELPRIAHELPHAREQDARVAGHHHQIRGARRVVDEQHLLPALAPVRGPEHASLCIGCPHVPQRAHEYDVGIGRIDHDPGDLADVAQTHELPALARVGRHEDAAAVHDVVPRVPLPGAHPHDIRVRRSERYGTDRRGRLVLEDRLPRIAAIDRLPYAARRGADVVHVAVSRYADDGGHAPAGHRGAEIAELEVVERIRAAHRRHVGRLFLLHFAATLPGDRESEGERQECTVGDGLTASQAVHRTSS